jgi:hypothetical protein
MKNQIYKTFIAIFSWLNKPSLQKFKKSMILYTSKGSLLTTSKTKATIFITVFYPKNLTIQFKKLHLALCTC